MATKERPKAEKTTSILHMRNIPASLLRHFKAWCGLRGVTMKDKIMSLMRDTVESTGK